MRIPSSEEYETAKAATAVYEAFTAPFVQRDGWTVIHADAPRPLFRGEPLTTDRVNAFSTTIELFELARDQPEKIFAYVSAAPDGVTWRITTWAGEVISDDLIVGRTYPNPRYSHTSNKITPVRALIAGRWYSGRSLGAGVYVKLRRCAAQTLRAA